MTLFLVLAVLLPWSIWRQMHAHEVTANGLIKLPTIFALIGVISIGHVELADVSTGTVVYLGASLLVSAALGAWRGSAITIWRDAGQWISQGNRLTISLWVALIAVKFALGTVASITGKLPEENAGEVFLFLGLSFAVQNVVVARRTLWSNARRAVTV